MVTAAGRCAAPEHNHDPRCRAVNFDLDTGAYTGTRAFDSDNCATCADEEDRDRS